MSTSVETPWVVLFAIAVTLVFGVPSGLAILVWVSGPAHRICISERTLCGHRYPRKFLGVER